MSKFKVGDVVPYRNTRGNIMKAEILSFKTVENGKVWFNGIDTDTKAKVWYPVHISEKLIDHQFKIGDHIDYLIGNEWQHDYATIHYFHRNSNLPIAETNRPGHDGCKWSYTFDLSTVRLTQQNKKMNKKDFQKKFPDVKLQELETKVVLSRAQVQECVIGLIRSLDTGLLYYDYSSRTIRVFTSDKIKAEIDKMIPGSQVTHPHSGKVGTIISDEPFIICGQMCVTVDFDGNKDAYDCEFFIKQ